MEKFLNIQVMSDKGSGSTRATIYWPDGGESGYDPIKKKWFARFPDGVLVLGDKEHNKLCNDLTGIQEYPPRDRNGRPIINDGQE